MSEDRIRYLTGKQVTGRKKGDLLVHILLQRTYYLVQSSHNLPHCLISKTV